MDGYLRRQAAMMTHRELQAAALHACMQLGLAVYHVGDPRSGPAGWPDLVIFGPGGIAYREIKTATGRLEIAQRRWGRTIADAGGDWAVWQPRDFSGGRVDHALTRLARVT